MQRKSAQAMELIDDLVRDPFFVNKITHVERIGSTAGRTVPLDVLNKTIDPRVLDALDRKGIKELYVHQYEAVKAVLEGSDVVVSTPTSSGKTLVYNTCVIDRLLKDPSAKALYVFPLKALARDQLKNLAEFARHLDMGISDLAAVYDGDTPDNMRRAIRERGPGIIITNPDMLHLSILSNRDSWEKFISGLRYVVLDEVHTYRGVFGSNVGNVFRRLWRILERMEKRPKVICTSATMGHTGDFLHKLLQRNFRVFDESTAPSSSKFFTFINPQRDAEKRYVSSSPATTARNLLVRFVKAGLRTICFTQSRKQAELVAKWTRESLGPVLGDRVECYRAGYLPEDRRRIEQRMASGELLGIVSTSALELGIDIGHLSSCILVGYPGTMISTWQRAGRVGRSVGGNAYISLIAGQDALDQYLVEHARELFGETWERAVIDPDNPRILEPHILCAAREMPVRQDEVGASPLFPLTQVLRLKNNKKLRTESGTGLLVTDTGRPHRRVNMRNMGFSFTIAGTDGRPIGDMDNSRIFRECHPGAIYLHRGDSYLVRELELLSHTVRVELTDSPNHTFPMVEKEVKAVRPLMGTRYGDIEIMFGEVRIEEEVIGYYERSPGPESRTVLEKTFEEPLPKQVLTTQGIWINLPFALAEELIEQYTDDDVFPGALHGAEHNLISLLPLYAMCDRWDVGGLSTTLHPDTGRPAIFVYDGIDGGMGFARRGFEAAREWFGASSDSLRDCTCKERNGCPSCIQSPKCGNNNVPLHREGAAQVMKFILKEMDKGLEEKINLGPLIPILPSDGKESGADAGENGGENSEVDGEVDGGENSEVDAGVDGDDRKETEREAIPPGVEAMIRKLFERGALIFDLETEKLAHEVGGWSNKKAMGISVVVTYDTANKKYVSYRKEDVDKLIEALYEAPLVVGFNLHNFDWDVMEGFPGFDRTRVCALDLFYAVRRATGRKISLNNLGKNNVGMEKTGDGFKAVEWARKGQMDKLEDYCRRDVEITYNLFYHVLRHGSIRFEVPEFEHVIEVEVDLWKNIERILS